MRFVPQDIIELEGMGDGTERPVDEVLGEAGVPVAFVHLRAMLSQQVEYRLIVDLEAELA
jgi:hypothetical protein